MRTQITVKIFKVFADPCYVQFLKQFKSKLTKFYFRPIETVIPKIFDKKLVLLKQKFAKLLILAIDFYDLCIMSTDEYLISENAIEQFGQPMIPRGRVVLIHSNCSNRKKLAASKI